MGVTTGMITRSVAVKVGEDDDVALPTVERLKLRRHVASQRVGPEKMKVAFGMRVLEPKSMILVPTFVCKKPRPLEEFSKDCISGGGSDKGKTRSGGPSLNKTLYEERQNRQSQDERTIAVLMHYVRRRLKKTNGYNPNASEKEDCEVFGEGMDEDLDNWNSDIDLVDSFENS
ncbi:hypothetical protein L484_018037 [Morus notabilis]|uniref:Uncharacterized protein n=1 Tax=Morus notabilis TaxID=981085 RepID=W9RJ19_9ROSA|nr:hypothetical protein L484_018037 [Morus notabilis]